MKNLPPFVNQLLLLALYAVCFFFVIQPTERFVVFVVGLLLGWLLLFLDEAKLHKYYLDPTSAVTQLITRSPLFLLGLVPMTVFVVFSTGSVLGAGVVLGIEVVLTYELWQSRANVAAFRQRFGQQLTRQLQLQEIGAITATSMAFVAIVTLLSLT